MSALVTLSQVNSTSPTLNLTWAYQNILGITELLLLYTPKSSTQFSFLQIELGSTSVDLSVLSPGVEYLLQLQVITSSPSPNVYYSNTLDVTTPKVLSAPVITSITSLNNALQVNLSPTSNILTLSDSVEFTLKDQLGNIFWVIMPYSNSNIYTLNTASNSLIVNYKTFSVACLFSPASSNTNYSSPSPMSNTINGAVPSDLPNPAQNLSVSIPASFQATLSWSVPSDFSYYSSSYSVIVGFAALPSNPSIPLSYTNVTLPGSTNPSSYTFTSGFTNQNYIFQVIYVNQYGSGQSATVSAIVYGQASPAQNVVLTPSDQSILVSWGNAISNGSTITSYQVYLNGTMAGSVTAPFVGNLSYNITGLTNGTSYNVYVMTVTQELGNTGTATTTQSAIPYGTSTISSVSSSGTSLTFNMNLNGSSFINAYVLVIPSNPSTSNSPQILNITPSMLTSAQQSTLTTLSYTASFSGKISTSIQEYFVVASSSLGGSCFSDNLALM